jgi:xanthine dehydrogenase small subunit
MRDHLRLYLNGQPLRVDGADAFLTLTDFVRLRLRLTGTKVVCAEGDCGSCTVLVGRPDDDGAISYRTVCGCILTLGQLDAAHVITVEGLLHDGRLNPVQEAMVGCHGAQCGFCTPGIVVSLYDLLQRRAGADAPPDPAAVKTALAGNLCRCTGYESILKAAAATDCAALRPLDALFPPDTILPQLRAWSAEPVEIAAGGHRFFKPVDVAAAVAFRAAHPGAAILAGGTDLGVLKNKHVLEPKTILSTLGLAELRGVRVDGGTIVAGASASLSELESAARAHLPELAEFLQWFGSPQIKNAGTVAGNLVTASPIGDTIPALAVLDAEVELAGVAGEGGSRTLPIGEFVTGYRRTALRPDELVVRVRIPLPAAGEVVRFYKVSRRRDLDISTFGCAIRLRRDGDTVADVRIALGGVAATVVRATEAESHLTGGPFTLHRMEEAGRLAAAAVTPLTDVRGSAEYRSLLVRNALTRFWHDVAGRRNADF